MHGLRMISLCVLVLAAACSGGVAVGPTVKITGEEWSAVPQVMEASGGRFTLTIENTSGEPIDFVVVKLNGAAADALPIRDGLLDVTQESRYASTYWIVYPDYERREGEGVVPPQAVPAALEAGESATVTIGTLEGGGEPGWYVVMSYQPGGYAAGDYAAFRITGG